MATAKSVTVSAATAIGVLAFLGMFLGMSSSMPRNALLLVDDSTHTYLAPIEECARPGRVLRSTNQGVPAGYRADADCRELGAFTDERGPLTIYLARKAKLWPSRLSRWNDDGSWNF